MQLNNALLSIVFLFCVASPSFSQSSIYGRIVDSGSDEALIGATVLIDGTSEGAVTDVDGYFSLETSRVIPFKINVSFLGFEEQSISIDKSYSQSNPLVVHMTESNFIGAEVLISASRRKEKSIEAPASTTVIESRKIQAQSLTNPAFVLKTAPGVDVTYQGIDQAQITLRGRNSTFTTETFFMLDNRSLMVPGQNIAIMSHNALSALDIERIEVVRGPGSALYGPGVETGVVHFISKSPMQYQGTSVSLGGGTNSSLSVAARHAQKVSDKWAYKILGHYNRARDFVLDPDDPIDAESLAAFQPVVISALTGEVLRDSNELEDQVFNYSISGALEFHPEPGTSLTASAGYTVRRGLVRASLGEALQDYPITYGQIRFSKGNFFAQAFTNAILNNNERGVLYRTGLTSVSNNFQHDIQIQNIWDLMNDKLELTVGGEIQLIDSATQGTVHGRYEAEDDFDIFSAYAQTDFSLAPNLNLITAARLDRFTAIDETTISPRATLLYEFTKNHNLRFSFNRAITSPSSLFVFGDIPFGVAPVFDIQFLGGIEPITFSDPVVTSSFLGGSYPGIDIPLAIPYSIALAGLEGAIPQEVLDYLASRTTEVTNTSAGVLLLNDQLVTDFPVQDKIRSTKTNVFEIGYKGIVSNKFAISLDVYYNQRRDLIFTGAVSPFVLNPTLTNDLVAEFVRVTDPAELAALGVPQDVLAGIIGEVAEGLVALGPLGLVQPEIEFDSQLPTLIVRPTNTGKVDYFGIDFSGQYYVTNDLSTFINYSWLSQNVFNDADLGLQGSGQEYALNVPTNRIRVGVDYIPEIGLTYNASVRYQNAMRAFDGTIFNGEVPAYTIVDASIGYDFGNGLQINLSGQNLLNNEYRIMPRMPKIGRLVRLQGTYEL